MKYRESLEDFNKLVSDNPRDVSYLKARATLAVEMNTPDLALLDLEEAAKLAPDDAEIYVMCGEIYLSQKKKREAYVAFEKAIELGVPRPELQDKLKASSKKYEQDYFDNHHDFTRGCLKIELRWPLLFHLQLKSFGFSQKGVYKLTF